LVKNEKRKERDCDNKARKKYRLTTRITRARARASATNSANYFSVILLNLSI